MKINVFIYTALDATHRSFLKLRKNYRILINIKKKQDTQFGMEAMIFLLQ